jgi:cathepsin B
MTDRLCIQSEGEVKFQFSPQDILNCCENCSTGCVRGGFWSRGWRYWTESGIVSGGDYDSYQVSNEGTKHSC